MKLSQVGKADNRDVYDYQDAVSTAVQISKSPSVSASENDRRTLAQKRTAARRACLQCTG